VQSASNINFAYIIVGELTTRGTTPTLIPNTNTVQEEHNRLFGYRAPSTARRSQPNRRRPTSCSSGTREKQPAWSRAFVCLSIMGQHHPQSTEERIQLILNGLGEK